MKERSGLTEFKNSNISDQRYLLKSKTQEKLFASSRVNLQKLVNKTITQVNKIK